MKKDFKKFISTLQDSIFTWGYFTDFEKAKNNIEKIERELNLLNSLIGKENLEDEFIDLIMEYPKVRKVLPILVAVRRDKLSKLPIVSNVETLIPENKKDIFYGEWNDNSEKELRIFFNSSGLKNIFQNKDIKNVVDYIFGVEVGMDTNARKNRTGQIMEDVVEKFISDFCEEQGFEYIPQATKTKILNKFGVEIKMQAITENKNGERKFDFAIFDKLKKQLIVIEVNYYSGTGSKPSSIAREYIDLEKIFKKEGIKFVWVTDGVGWENMKNPLKKTIEENDYVINLKMLKDNILKDIILEE